MISRPIILGGSVVVLLPAVGVEDGCGGVTVERGTVVLVGVVTTPGDIRLDELERLADIESDWETLIGLVTRLDELEPLADIESDWETLIGLVTTLDELEPLADIESDWETLIGLVTRLDELEPLADI